jgi:ATP-dependent DNA helicase RecQ
MGFDKPDLGFIVHFQRPGSVVAYYQQVGRAGRGVDHADAVLLVGAEDDDIADYFISSAFPPIAHQQAVLAAVAATSATTVPKLEAALNLRRGQIDKALTLLEIEGAVAHDRGGWFRTANRWTADQGRIDALTEIRRAELGQMQDYVRDASCRMRFVAAALDDPEAADCGRCDRCLGVQLALTVEPDDVRDAITFLRRDARPIEPRKVWPSGAVPELHGRIPRPNLPGMALSVYGDAGWGRLVRQGKYVDERFAPALVEAAADLIRDRWRPDPMPAWVTGVPSATRPALVGEFARGLADALGLPFTETLVAVPGPAQKQMENSAQQLRNITAKIWLGGPVPGGTGLLVDDIADSGWTLTYAGHLLRSAGATDIIPFVLAIAAGGD